jgi:hypothetical protein
LFDEHLPEPFVRTVEGMPSDLYARAPGKLTEQANVHVVAQCVGCKAEKNVGPGEGQPFCDKCGSVMVAVRAEADRV